MLYYSFANPFFIPWINLFSKLGPSCMVFLLGLMSWHRVEVAKKPTSDGNAQTMLLVTAAYAYMFLASIIVVAVLPVIQRSRQESAEREKRRNEIEEAENQITVDEESPAAVPVEAQWSLDPVSGNRDGFNLTVDEV